LLFCLVALFGYARNGAESAPAYEICLFERVPAVRGAFSADCKSCRMGQYSIPTNKPQRKGGWGAGQSEGTVCKRPRK